GPQRVVLAGAAAGGEVAVDLVGGDLDVAGAGGTRPLEQYLRAQHVGADELGRVEDGAVDVGLGGEVDDRLAAPGGSSHRVGIGDVADDERRVHALEVGRVAGVRELVEHDDLVPRRDETAHEVRADEAGAAGDEDPRHGGQAYPRAAPAPSRRRHSATPSRQCGSRGAPGRSLRSTEYGGRRAGRSSSALEIRRTRQRSPASSNTASARSAQVQSPSAATCQTPRSRSASTSSRTPSARCPTYVGQPRWSSTTATSSRSRPSCSIVRTKLRPVGPNSQEVRTTHASLPAAPSPC